MSAVITKEMKQKADDLKKRADHYQPRIVCQDLLNTKRIAHLATGGMHVVAVVEGGGQVFAWGKNTEG